MNLKQNNYFQKYIRSRLKGKDRMAYLSYSVKHNKLEFCFESVGMFNIHLICGSTPMTYNLITSVATCGCGVFDCKHKESLKEYIEEITTK